MHRALAVASGAVGGSFGLAGLPVELPISTIIMLRSIGDVARSEGEDIADPETHLQHFERFDASETRIKSGGETRKCSATSKSTVEDGGDGPRVPAGIRSRGREGEVDAAESGYFAVRGMLAKSVVEAARFVAERGVLAEGGPVPVRFIAQVAARFGVGVKQKLAAQALPIMGAISGAAVNYAFIDHFQEAARAHYGAPAQTTVR